MAIQIGMAKAMEAGGKLLTGGAGAAPEPAAAAGEGAGATPDLATGPEPAGAPSAEGGPAPEESPAAPAAAEPGTVDLSGEAANDNALPGPETAEQVLAAAGTDGPVDVGPAGPPLQVIEGGAGGEGAPRAMAGEVPTSGGPGSEPPSTTTASTQVAPSTAEERAVRAPVHQAPASDVPGPKAGEQAPAAEEPGMPASAEADRIAQNRQAVDDLENPDRGGPQLGIGTGTHGPA